MIRTAWRQGIAVACFFGIGVLIIGCAIALAFGDGIIDAIPLWAGELFANFVLGVVGCSGVVYVPLQIQMGYSWRGIWRAAALAPIVPMVAVFVLIPGWVGTESNLFPIAWAMYWFVAMSVGTGCLLILMGTRRLARQLRWHAP